jgi:hypothetical protein
LIRNQKIITNNTANPSRQQPEHSDHTPSRQDVEQSATASMWVIVLDFEVEEVYLINTVPPNFHPESIHDAEKQWIILPNF